MFITPLATSTKKDSRKFSLNSLICTNLNNSRHCSLTLTTLLLLLLSPKESIYSTMSARAPLKSVDTNVPTKKKSKKDTHTCPSQLLTRKMTEAELRHYGLPTTYYRDFEAVQRMKVNTETTTIPRHFTARDGITYTLECKHRNTGFGRQPLIESMKCCPAGPDCTNGKGEWHPKKHKLEIQRVFGLRHGTLQSQNGNPDYVTADHLCHSTDGVCVNPDHLDFSSLGINKGRNGCPGPNNGCLHAHLVHNDGRICRPCIMPGLYSGNIV